MQRRGRVWAGWEPCEARSAEPHLFASELEQAGRTASFRRNSLGLLLRWVPAPGLQAWTAELVPSWLSQIPGQHAAGPGPEVLHGSLWQQSTEVDGTTGTPMALPAAAKGWEQSLPGGSMSKGSRPLQGATGHDRQQQRELPQPSFLGELQPRAGLLAWERRLAVCAAPCGSNCVPQGAGPVLQPSTYSWLGHGEGPYEQKLSRWLGQALPACLVVISSETGRFPRPSLAQSDHPTPTTARRNRGDVTGQGRDQLTLTQICSPPPVLV